MNHHDIKISLTCIMMRLAKTDFIITLFRTINQVDLVGVM